MLKRFFLFAALAALGLLTAGPAQAQAQGLSLAQLLALSRSATPDSARSFPALAHRLPGAEWRYRGPVGGTRDFYWTSFDPDAGAAELPDVWLSLRPSQRTHDVVFKTTVPGYEHQLRRDVAQHQLKAERLSCPDCEAVRYRGTGFVLTLYSRKKPDKYPFVAVLRLLPAPGTSAARAAAP